MAAVIGFVLASLSILIVSASTLSNPSLILPSSAKANATSSNYIHRCDGTAFGHDLDTISCVEALSQIDVSSTTQQTYGARFSGPYDVKLPKRYINSDGRCIIEPRLKQGESSAHASLQEVESAAAYVINKCVAARPSQGGEVGDIGDNHIRAKGAEPMLDPIVDEVSGGDHNLNIVVEKYQPQVRCSGAVSPMLLSSCQNIVDTMSTSRDFTTWGPENDPLAVMKLPVSYYSLDRRCKMSIRTNGPTDTASRYQFWTVAVALTGICVRSGQSGTRDNLGLSDYLSMEIGPA